MVSPSSNSLRKPKLTPKQAKFVKAKIAGKSGVAAAQEAYPGVDYSVANAIAHENLNKPSIAAALEAAYARQGITVDALVKPIADGLQAEKTIIIGSGDDAFADQIPDHSIRIAAAKLGGQWLGMGKEVAVSGGVHFHQHTAEKKAEYDD